MKRYFGFLFVPFFTVIVWGQTNNDPIYVNYGLFPKSEMDKIDEEGALQMLDVNLILPDLKLNEKTEVYTQLSYKLSSFSFENGLDEFLPENLNDIRLGLIVRHTFSDKWEMIATPRINIRSDFSKDVLKHGLFPSFNILGIRYSQKTKNLSYGLGVSYNNDVDKNFIIPLGYLKYHNENFRVYTILPSFLHFILTPSEKFEYGLSVNLDASIYHIEPLGTVDTRNYLKNSQITMAPVLGYNFFNKLWINAKAGYVMNRRFQVLDGRFDELEFNKDNKLKPGFFAMVGVSLRVE